MVLQVCASGVQLVCAPARSLWPTLASAASSLALFGAAGWGILHEKNFIVQLVWHTLVFAMPLFPLQSGLDSALCVWSIKRSIQNKREEKRREEEWSLAKQSVQLDSIHSGKVQVDRGSIPILSICPLYIQVPWSAHAISSADEELIRTRDYELVGDPKDLCPLELAPKNTNHQQLQDSAAHDVNEMQDAVAAHDNEKKYLKFSVIDSLYLKGLKEREVLLTLGLAPQYSQLRFLRSRNRFQTAVTGLQAGGYVLSVVQRLAQQLTVCPLEALLCFLSIIIILQLLVELYACSHYQRPLLLRLNQQQFAEFWAAPRDNETESSLYLSFKRYRFPFLITVVLLLVMLFSGLSIYYSVHYMDSCRVCSVAAALFLFALLAWVMGFILLANDLASAASTIIFVFSALIFVSSMVIAVVSTATHWDLFHSPTTNSFSWILPHVSSQA